MSRDLAAAWEELRWGQRPLVISNPASHHSVNMGSGCGLEIHNHSWHIQDLHGCCFHYPSENNPPAVPPSVCRADLALGPHHLQHPSCCHSAATEKSPATSSALLAGTFFFAVGPSCRCAKVLPPPVWLQHRPNTRAVLRPGPAGLIQGLQMPFRSLILNT